jgi:hypothetical protein
MSDKILRILVTTQTGQKRAGCFRLVNGKLETEANKGFDESMESVKDINCLDGDDLVTSADDPERWFELLPYDINGTGLRAEHADDDDDYDDDGSDEDDEDVSDKDARA